jgi:hypothetical protein
VVAPEIIKKPSIGLVRGPGRRVTGFSITGEPPPLANGLGMRESSVCGELDALSGQSFDLLLKPCELDTRTGSSFDILQLGGVDTLPNFDLLPGFDSDSSSPGSDISDIQQISCSGIAFIEYAPLFGKVEAEFGYPRPVWLKHYTKALERMPADVKRALAKSDFCVNPIVLDYCRGLHAYKSEADCLRSLFCEFDAPQYKVYDNKRSPPLLMNLCRPCHDLINVGDPCRIKRRLVRVLQVREKNGGLHSLKKVPHKYLTSAQKLELAKHIKGGYRRVQLLANQCEWQKNKIQEL